MRAKARKLTARQQRLFDEFLPMAEAKGRALAAKYSRFDREEIVQYAREGLWRACYSWRYLGYWEFEPFARQRIDWWIKKSLFVVAGAAAFREARLHEVSGSEVVAHDRKEVTLLEAADDNLGDDEFQDDSAAAHQYDRYAEVLAALDHADLTPHERKAILLRYSEGLDDAAIGRRLKERYPEFLIRCAVRKLRAYFAARGYDTLPITAPLPNLGFPGRNA